MKVLWIVNIIFPEPKALLNGSNGHKSSGGWLLSYADLLNQHSDIKLVIATASDQVKFLTKFNGVRNTYYLFPIHKNYRAYSADLLEIKQNESPDLIHIHGTEYPYGLAYVEACGSDKVVLSIQGIISEVCKYYNAGLSDLDILKHLTVRDLFGRTLWHEKRKRKKDAVLERRLIQNVNHIIGRTAFDRAHVWAINPDAYYHKCNEPLRDEFYAGRWTIETCKPHSIFVSQAWYPLKGFHMLLKAMPLLLRSYPDITINIAGSDILDTKGLIGRLRWQGYYKYISRLIKRFGLNGKINFMGPLSAERMKNALLSSNVFVCPSSIENSSNSLAEAQLLGVPSVVSYVGGLPDMISRDSNCLLYRFDDTDMLAYSISKIFDTVPDGSIQQEEAKRRHNKKEIANTLTLIYNSVQKN